MKKKLSGWMQSVIQGGAGVGGLFLGVVIARVIGIADGLGVGIGMMAGLIVGGNFLLPYFEKRKKEEPLSEDIEEGELLTDEEEKQVWEEYKGKVEEDKGSTS